MKYIAIMFILVLQGCQSQSDFDLLNLKLKKDKIESFIPEHIKHKTHPSSDITDGNYVTGSYDKELLTFNQISFAGRVNPEQNYLRNDVRFFYNKKDSILEKYQLSIYTTDLSKKLLETLIKKFGEPNFTKYDTEKKENPDGFIWVDKENDYLYLLNYAMKKHGREALLTVVVNSQDTKILRLYPPFSYWEDFLDEKNKRKDLNYTYYQFIKDESISDDDNFYKKLTTGKKPNDNTDEQNNKIKDFDLARINFSEKITDLITNNLDYATYLSSGYENKLSYLKTVDKRLVVFNELKLADGKNEVIFNFNKKDKLIKNYELYIYNSKGKELIKSLKEELGEPNYTEYHDSNYRERDEPEALIWEKKEQNLIYFFQFYNGSTGFSDEKSVLFVKVNSPDVKIPSTFWYWREYIEARKKKQDLNYTYQQFIKEKGGLYEHNTK